ncbi:MAG: hypothetical protein INR71_13495 [Terriglobus roseus]|nr:hypothetical protein [Terriglobus roseus]
MAVGGAPAGAQHGKSNSVSPVNGKQIPPAVPSVAPAIVNSSAVANGSQADHSRKSSVTISSSQGYMPNGGASGHASRASITFGSMNPGGSPAVANSVPHDPQSLPTPPTNPRVTSPSHSPSPIPTPAPSGGRPPSSLQGQSIPLSFGSTAGESNDQNVCDLLLRPVNMFANFKQMRAVSMPQGPAALGPQSQHLRRESSQSSHSDMGTPGMNTLNRPYNPGSGRGRGYQQNYSGPPMVPSPGPQFRQPYGPQQRGGPQGMQPFQPQSPMRHVSAPFQANRSPAMNQATLHQPHMPNGVPMFQGYPQHLQPQVQFAPEILV